MTPRVAVVVFPGTNCERDCERALSGLGASPRLVWHNDKELGDVDCVVLPGGFAHGDYLRTGALARFSPIMEAVRAHAERGGLVLGICNGFQILCEAGMLPGALRKNSGLKFLCTWTDVRVENPHTRFTRGLGAGDVLRLPINHFEGNWYCEPDELRSLRAEGRLVLRYVDNPNGSLADVAGVTNAAGNVFGLMPHPERACETLLGSTSGAALLSSMLDAACA
jgi:phosphoribosylformylglycinamidine synthase subunit PurQ / glutaminase